MHVPPVHTHRNKRKQTVNKKRESRPSPTITAACSLTVARNVERCLRSCSQSFPPLWTVPSAVWPAHPWLIYVPFFLCFVIETGNETKTPLLCRHPWYKVLACCRSPRQGEVREPSGNPEGTSGKAFTTSVAAPVEQRGGSQAVFSGVAGKLRIPHLEPLGRVSCTCVVPCCI